jgi:hypothetical protein
VTLDADDLADLDDVMPAANPLETVTHDT